MAVKKKAAIVDVCVNATIAAFFFHNLALSASPVHYAYYYGNFKFYYHKIKKNKNRESRGANLLLQGQGTASIVGYRATPHIMAVIIKIGI